MALSLLAVGALAGKCTQEMADCWLDKPTFSVDIQECAVEKFGMGSEVATCLKGKYSVLSDDCAACFGETVDCGRIKCIQDCANDSFADQCIGCTESAGCNSELVTCTGFQGPPIPSVTTPSGVSAISSPVALITIAIIGALSYF